MAWKELENPWVHVFLAGALGLFLLVSGIQAPVVRRAMDLTSWVLAWPEAPAASLRAGVSTLSAWVTERNQMVQRLSELEEENIGLRAALMQKGVTHVKRTPGSIFARVTLRPPQRWWQEARLTAAGDAPIRKGAAVLQNGFLAGRIVDVDHSQAWMELITSSGLLVPVIVDETRDLAVVAGDDAGRVLLLYIPTEKVLTEGMSVSTALASETLPPGIPVGRIAASGDEMGGYRIYVLRQGADLSRLDEVSIMAGAP